MALPKFTWKANRAYVEEIRFNTLVSQFESGKEQRRSKGPPRRVFRLEFEKSMTTNNDAKEIWEFIKARKGQFEAFEWDYTDENGNTETVKVRLTSDVVSREVFMNTIYRFGLQFIEVI